MIILFLLLLLLKAGGHLLLGKKTEQQMHAGFGRRSLGALMGRPDKLKRLTTTETLAARVVEAVMLRHAAFREGVHRLCSRPSFQAAGILWALGFSLSWCSTLSFWRRDDCLQRWDFQLLSTWHYAIQEVFLAAATLEFSLSFTHQVEVLSFVWSPAFWVELVTLPPCIVFVRVTCGRFLGDYRISHLLLLTGCLRWLKTFVYARFVSSSLLWGSHTKGQIVQLILGISLMLLTFASAMFTAESIHPFDGVRHPSEEAFLSFWAYLYFGVVTMSTVGYGDIHPQTWVGQGLCVVFIVTSLVWVPREFAVLIDSFSSRGKIFGSLPVKLFGGPFILLVGDVSPSQLSAFIQEARLRSDAPPKLVLLTSAPLDGYAQQLREAHLGRVRLCFVNGEAGIGGLPGDLQLVQPISSCWSLLLHACMCCVCLSVCLSVSSLRGVFVLSPPASFNVFSDRQVLTRVVSLLKADVEPANCCVQLGTEICANVIATMGVSSFIILSDLKMALISRSLSDCPGIIPLITNLCSSSYPDLPTGLLRLRFCPAVLSHMEAYIRGATYALYSFRVPPCMLGLEFEEVVLNLFRLGGILTLGLERGQGDWLSPSLLPPLGRVRPAGGRRRVPSCCCCTRQQSDGLFSSQGSWGAACSEPQPLSPKLLIGGTEVAPAPPTAAAAPSAAAAAAAPRATAAAAAKAPTSYWLNPSGEGCHLRPGDRLIVIASSVSIAECLQYATRLPWIPRAYGMRSLLSQAFNFAGGDRRSASHHVGMMAAKASFKDSLLRCDRHPPDCRVKQTERMPTLKAPNHNHACMRGGMETGMQTGMQQRQAPAAADSPTLPLHSSAAEPTTAASLLPGSPLLQQSGGSRGGWRARLLLPETDPTTAAAAAADTLEEGLAEGAALAGPRLLEDPSVGQQPPFVKRRASRDLLLQQPHENTSSSSTNSGAAAAGIVSIAGKIARACSVAGQQNALSTQASLGGQGPPQLQGPPFPSQQKPFSVAAAVAPASRFEPEEDSVLPVLRSEAVGERQAAVSADLSGARQTERGGHLEQRVSDLSDEVSSSLQPPDTSKSASKAYACHFADPSRPLILVCGWPKFLHRLLRKLAVGSTHNVVILAAETPPVWADVSLLAPFSSFTAIVNGRPLSELDLIRAGVLKARCIYIFPLALDNLMFESAASEQQHNDRNAILVYLQLRHLLLHKTDVLEASASGDANLQPQQPAVQQCSGNSGSRAPLSGLPKAVSSSSSSATAAKRPRPPMPPLRGEAPGPPPQGARPPPRRGGFWERRQQAAARGRGWGSSSSNRKRDSSLKNKTPFLFRGFAGGELLILELQEHDNWRFITDAEWIDRDLQQAPCYSAASYLHSTAFMNGSLFCDRMLYSLITQNEALSEFSVSPAIFLELPGIQLQEVPSYAAGSEVTFGELLLAMLRMEKKIPLALYRQGLDTLEHYVVTCPPQDCLLQRTDRVYVLLAGAEKMCLTPDRVVKRINAHLSATLSSKLNPK
ncbi:hypothetical protein Efla_006347 [Eimeria flavescens]